ncbi:MAG TPA: hypothetical protein VFE42_06485 [Chloroflexota bacterium]|nr:hypothetical protein [Chloroflexota bacterium]
MKTLNALGHLIRTNHHWKRVQSGIYTLAAVAVLFAPLLQSHWK